MITDWRDEILGGLWSEERITPANTTPIALSLDVMISYLILATSDGVLTLAKANAGQYKLLFTIVDVMANDATLTGIFEGGSTFNFSTGGDGVLLRSNGSKWEVIAVFGNTWGDVRPTPSGLGSQDYRELLLRALGRVEFHTGAGASYEMVNEATFMNLDMSANTTTLTFENDGVPGQYKHIVVGTGGNLCTINSALFKGFTSIEVKDKGDGAILYMNGEEWEVVRMLNDAKKV